MVNTKSKFNVRLLKADEPGSDLYNLYQLHSMMTSMYVKAMERGGESEFKNTWNTATDKAIEQVGCLHTLWRESYELNKNKVVDRGRCEVLYKRAQTLALRMAVLDLRLNDWVPLERTVMFMAKMEQAILGYAMRAIRKEITLQQDFAEVKLLILDRMKQLRQIATESLDRKTWINVRYAEPVSLAT
jgi:hypothetical protein